MRSSLFLLASLLALMLLASPAAAQLSLGFHAGFDLNGQDAQVLAASQLSDGTWVAIEREAIQAPLLGGIHLRFTAAPIVDLEFGFEGSLREYHVAYEHRESDNVTVIAGERFADDAVFGRLSIYASGKLNLVDLPLVKVYGGGGVGYHFLTPLLSQELLEAKMVAEGLTGNDLKPSDLLAREGVLGGQVLAGLRFSPNFLPLAISAEGRYHLLAENDYGDDTNRFFSAVFGLDLGF